MSQAQPQNGKDRNTTPVKPVATAPVAPAEKKERKKRESKPRLVYVIHDTGKFDTYSDLAAAEAALSVKHDTVVCAFIGLPLKFRRGVTLSK